MRTVSVDTPGAQMESLEWDMHEGQRAEMQPGKEEECLKQREVTDGRAQEDILCDGGVRLPFITRLIARGCCWPVNSGCHEGFCTIVPFSLCALIPGHAAPRLGYSNMLYTRLCLNTTEKPQRGQSMAAPW